MRHQFTHTITPHHQTAQPAGHLRSALLAAIGLVLSAALVLGGALTARATVGIGAGFGSLPPDHTIGWEGAYVMPNGQQGYCLTPSEHGPTTPGTATNDAGLWTNWNGTSGNLLAGVNRIISTHGQSGDPVQGSAVDFAVKNIVAPATLYAMRGYPNDATWPYGDISRYVIWTFSSGYPITDGNGTPMTSAQMNQVASLAAQYTQEARSTTAATDATGSGRLEFTVDATNDDAGTVTMIGTAGASGTITLVNGRFVSTGSTTLTGAEQGVAYAITGIPPADDGAPYRISGTGSFTPPGGGGWLAQVRVWQTAGYQTLATGGGTAVAEPFAVSGEDAADRTVTFRPVVATRVHAEYYERGDSLVDVLTFGTTADSAGLDNPWYRMSDGDYLPITASGVVYGPFAQQPEQSATPPAGSPIAATATVTTGDGGPTVTYDATASPAVSTSGFYTWVWTIERNAQPAAVAPFLPSGYAFAAPFGQVAESSIVPARIRASTQVATSSVRLSELAVDTAEVSVDGLWLQDAGRNIPVVFRWDAYHDPRARDEISPVATIPADARLIGTVHVTAEGAGTISTPTAEASGILAPASGTGSVVWVLGVHAEDQPAQYREWVEPWRDDYGRATEIQSILQPAVTTLAQPAAPLGGTLSDVATVAGPLPVIGAELSFAAYRVPLDADGRIAYPAGVPEGDLSWVCTDANRVFDSAGTPQVITEPGAYTSPSIPADAYAPIVWVELLGTNTAVTAAPSQTIARGACGRAEETSLVLDLATTAAAADAERPVPAGAEVTDTITVTGWVPDDAVARIDAFRVASAEELVCLEGTEVFSQTFDVAAGLHSAADPFVATSQPFVPETWGEASTLAYVATIHDEEGRILAQGLCGEDAETLTLAAHTLPPTGGTAPVPTLIGAAALTLGATSLLAFERWRRPRPRA
ncbi:hypothetical protein GCM10009808_14960 [Microbacterium sediminicola]|uniref:LPXTG-motif cell wall anchor domain-containing protein n=1 Tax=Microbacterium sediminicola TaxID=415210 RepID=A0ABN2I4G6_9MICO